MDEPNEQGQALVPVGPPVLSRSANGQRSVRSRRGAWQPPEGLMPDDVHQVIAAAETERDRLLLRVLWATGARISEVLTLTPAHVRRDALVLPNLKNPARRIKTVFLPAGEADLPGALLLWAREQGLSDREPLFFSRKRAPGWERHAISRQQAWLIVKAASRRAGVQVLALRGSSDGHAGEPAPIHPHLLRHARVRQTLRHTKNLPLAMRQAGWARLQTAYLTVGEEEARTLMAEVPE